MLHMFHVLYRLTLQTRVECYAKRKGPAAQQSALLTWKLKQVRRRGNFFNG